MIRFIAPAALAAALFFAPNSMAQAAGHAVPIDQVKAAGGTILVDGTGMSLYTWDNDRKGTSNCNGGCAKAWPPLLAAGSAHDAGDFTVITRKDGARQWAYKGQALYGWQGDATPGDITGDGVGGTWHLARP